MPSGKGRSKEDTWKESDLKKAIQGDKKRSRDDDESKRRTSHREDDRRERRSDRDDERKRRERKEDITNGDDKEREQRRRERDSERARKKDRDGEKPRDRSERDKESRSDKERRREQEGESSGIGERERRDREPKDSERRRTKDKESDKDRERRHRSREDGKDRSRDDRKSTTRDHGSVEQQQEQGADDKRSDKDRERRKRREEVKGESSRHHDRSEDSKRDKSREHDPRDRRKERDHDDSKKTRDKNREKRRESSKERDDRKRRSKQTQEELGSRRRPPKGERFRADTLEKADAVEEEDITKEKNRKNSLSEGKVLGDGVGPEDDYEEDFEDYEDDFENELEDGEDNSFDLKERNAGMQELLKAINLENETVRTLSREGSKLSRSSDDESKKESPFRPPTAKGRINFVAAKQKQISKKVASRTRKRGQELMHLIDLDVVVFDMFDLPPMNEYELYIKNFGRSDTKQAYVQCNEDNLEKEIQTEEIETRTMWTQNPAEDFAGCGGEDGSRDEFASLKEQTNIDSVRLARFLQRAGQACLVLLEESCSDHSSTMIKDKKGMTCSDGYIPLVTKQPYLTGRAIVCLHVSPVQSHLLLAAYGPAKLEDNISSKISESIATKSIVCLWNVNEPSAPQKVLVCESVPRCCCLSPSKATIAFAGLEDGSVVAWDLRESSSIHQLYSVEDSHVILRAPTFSTAGVLSQDNHHSPVVSLLPVVMPGDSAKASSGLTGCLQADEMLGLSFQLASLEENALINIWVVVELDMADIAGSESDLGLAPGGKIKLIKSASLPLEPPTRGIRKTTSLQTYSMRFLPQDPNHLYIGTDQGYVLHSVRHGGRAPPKAYRQPIECLVDVTAIDVSPWQLPCILAGSKDGVVRLYNIHNELPVSTWARFTKGSPIESVQWSRSKPSVFYVLDANSTLHIWDLLNDESAPVAVEKSKHKGIVSFELSSDYTATGIGVPGRSPELVLGYKDGSVQVHKLNARFAKASADELDRFHSYLEGAL